MKRFLFLCLCVSIVVAMASCSKNSEKSVEEENEEREQIYSSYTEEIDHDAVLSIMGAFSPLTVTHGNPLISGFPLSPTGHAYDYPYDCQLFATDEPYVALMAENYVYDESEHVLSVTLKEGLLWSDGVPIDIMDYYASIVMQLNKSFMWDYIENCWVVDERTVGIDFIVANPAILQKALGQYINIKYSEYKEWVDQIAVIVKDHRTFDENLMRFALTSEGNKLYSQMNVSLQQYKPALTDIAVSGPYYFKSYSNDLIVMERNELYWNVENVHFKTLNIHLAPSSVEAQTLLIRSGELDMDSVAVTPEITKQLENQFPGMKTLLRRFPTQVGLAFNFEKYPVNIPEVRKAISMVIDRDQILDVRKPNSTIGDIYGTGLAPMLIELGIYADMDYVSTLPSYEYNLEKAAETLQSIGWKLENGFWVDAEGKKVELEISSSGISLEAEICRDMLDSFGFSITYNPYDGAVEWKAMTEGKHMIRFGVLNSTFLEFPDPWSIYNSQFFFPMGRIRESVGADRYGTPYIVMDSSGKEYDIPTMINRLRTVISMEELKEMVKELVYLTNDLCPITSIYEETAVLRIYDNSLRWEVEGYDNKSKLTYIDDYDSWRNGFFYALKVGKVYKVTLVEETSVGE